MQPAHLVEPERDLVLVGGGHAHVQVIRRWMMRPVPGVRLCVVLDQPVAAYSGMVPAYVAGELPREALEIDVVPLARRAGARVVLSAATRVDPVARTIEFADRPALPYDLASIDVGSSVRGLSLPGVRSHALATRPIGRFVAALDARLEALPAAPRVVVVGTGAAGVELAFTLDARLRRAGRSPRLVLVGESASLLAGASPRVSEAVAREAERRGVGSRSGVRVAGVARDAVGFEGDAPDEAADLVVWATGAAPPALAVDSPLPTDAAGYIAVRDTLQVEGHDALFAVGDCASMRDYPDVPKAGVYAVRQGPVLDANLRAMLAGRSLRRYRPQRGFLSLLNLGNGRALGAKWGVALSGRAVWRLKDWIDRRFMRRFQVLDGTGALARDFPTPESMGMEPMDCGGCAAKLAPARLESALARLPAAKPDASVVMGLSPPDDVAGVLMPGGDTLLATIDGFRAFSDDPWLVGRVATVNALSDVYAKGGRPRHALALVTVPDEDPRRAEETLHQVLRGVRAALDPAEVSLVGGHTTRGPELFVALSITGDMPPEAATWPIEGARVGDRLVLTRALGSGVLLAADMQGRARGAWLQGLHATLTRSNRTAVEVARRFPVHAATDVSGFGLAGHLLEMLRAGGVSAELSVASLPRFAGVAELLAAGVRSTFAPQNAALGPALCVAPALPERDAALAFDPQTSGGVLLSLPPDAADALVDALHAAGEGEARVVGSVQAAGAAGPCLRLV